jgi:hypothetical protein
MRYHRFKIDQTVVSSMPSLPAERYTIVRLLPLVHGEPHYRVMGKNDGRERAVLEGEIRLPGLYDDRLVHEPTDDGALAAPVGCGNYRTKCDCGKNACSASTRSAEASGRPSGR